MKRACVLLAVFVSLAVFGTAFAGGKGDPVTYEGEVVCAMCILKEEGFKECQTVLQVAKSDEGDYEHYYIVKNEVAEDFGHACKAGKAVKMTGTIAEEDGRMWITATEIDVVDES